MLNQSRLARLACIASLAVALSGCGVEVGLATGIQAGLQAKKAKSAVDAEKEAVKKIEESMAKSQERNEKALANEQISSGNAASVVVPQVDTSAAMKAAEEAAK